MDSSSHLRKNIQDQINRLMSQLEDLEAGNKFLNLFY